MAELILTDEEKEAPYYQDWTDEALGKLVRTTSQAIDELGSEKDSIWASSASHLLVSYCQMANSTETKIDLDGYTIKGVDCGDWQITIKRKRNPTPTA